LKRDEVKISSVPMIDGLQLSEILNYGDGKYDCYFPDKKDWVHVDRKWLCDVLFTLDTEGFQKFV
jgi:hypothetical protein